MTSAATTSPGRKSRAKQQNRSQQTLRQGAHAPPSPILKKQSDGWEMTPQEALRVNFVDNEI